MSDRKYGILLVGTTATEAGHALAETDGRLDLLAAESELEAQRILRRNDVHVVVLGGKSFLPLGNLLAPRLVQRDDTLDKIILLGDDRHFEAGDGTPLGVTFCDMNRGIIALVDMIEETINRAAGGGR